MTFRVSAEKLIDAATSGERGALLKTIRAPDLLEIARAVKEISYEFWTSEPTKTGRGAVVLRDLARRDANPEIAALAEWILGIAALTTGKLPIAVKKLDRAADIFRGIGKEYEAAQTQVGKLYALALLGRYDEAVAVGEKSLKIFADFGDELAAGKIELNLSNIVSRRAEHRAAEKYCLSARARFAALGETAWLTMAENGLANTYAESNDFRRAEKFYALAKRGARRNRMRVTEAEIEASVGNLALFRGRLDAALKHLESSRRQYAALEMPHQSAVAELEIADVYLELNLTNEACEIYERVAATFANLKMRGEQARARANFGRVAALLKLEETARRELKTAAKLYRAERNPVGAAAVKLSEAALELSLGNFQKALDIARAAENLSKANGNLRQQLTARFVRGDALRHLKKYVEAEILLKKTFADAARNEQSNLALAAQTSLGRLFVAQNKNRRAARHFQKAIALTERMRAPLPAEEFRMAYLAAKLAPFEELAKIYLSENRIEKAFLQIETARSRSLAESLGGDAATPNAGEESGKMQAELGVLREELNWFYSRLNRAESGEIAGLQREARAREKKIGEKMRQIESTGAARSGGESEFDAAQLQSLLKAERALVEYVASDGKLSAFFVTNEKIEYVADLCAENDILPLLEGLRFQFGALRYGGANLNAFLPQMKKRADFYLAALYEKLLAPLETLFGNCHLTIVPVGALHYVPFHALRGGEKYVVETRQINYAPSATVLQICASKPARRLDSALLVAHADADIPLVDAEVESLGKIFKRSKTLTGDAATVAAFAKEAAKFDVLHLACHGEFRPDNPMFSSLHLADGFVTVRDICVSNLRAELVTLSACETGLNSIFAGDEILGLSRGFLTAGTSSLVLSLWTVSDAATSELMRGFYAQLQAGKRVAASLRAAQIEFIRRDAHPYFWSPFAAIGKW